jgi:hypothetical protein
MLVGICRFVYGLPRKTKCSRFERLCVYVCVWGGGGGGSWLVHSSHKNQLQNYSKPDVSTWKELGITYTDDYCILMTK